MTTSLTKVDWFGCRTTAQIPEVLEAVEGAFLDHAGFFDAKDIGKGWNGFEQTKALTMGGERVGMMAYGGRQQKGWVAINLSGAGCAWIEDWAASEAVYAGLRSYETRRLDIALDTYHREVTHDKVLAEYRAGSFDGDGRPPAMKMILNEDPMDGQTIYIGKRENGKFLRGYEKGCEMVSKLNTALEVTHIDGIPVLDFYRLELELKAKQGPLPLDLIEKRDQYFSGAYPYLARVIDAAPLTYSQSKAKAVARSVEAAAAQIRSQYGNTIYTLLEAYGGDVGRLFNDICGTKHNDDLVAAGALLFERLPP